MAKQEWKIGDCLELLPTIEDKSIDMILTDLPYGITGCKWDTVIPFEPLWEQYKRIIKDNGAIVLTASQPFTSALIMSNVDMFKYEWIWAKEQGTGHLNSNHMPMRSHENVCVFNATTYNPQKIKTKKRTQKRTETATSENYGMHNVIPKPEYTHRMPKSVIKFNRQTGIHPTQKPVALFEYLIKTYTNEGDIVHDSCLGSGTTLEACMNTNRNCIGFELSREWEEHYKKRLRLDNSKLTDDWNKQ